MGGEVIFESGSSILGGSGSINIHTANSSGFGPSGSVFISSGTSAHSRTGEIRIVTGKSGRIAGRISLVVGTSASEDGAMISLEAGDTSSSASKGGLISIISGDGTNAELSGGGSGGDGYIAAGNAFGRSLNDNGGKIQLVGGNADVGMGGAIELSTGRSLQGSR